MPKSLFKLARNKLFEKEYYCSYYCTIDLNKEYMSTHITHNHDEYGKAIKLFYCRKCNVSIEKNEITVHLFTHLK